MDDLAQSLGQDWEPYFISDPTPQTLTKPFQLSFKRITRIKGILLDMELSWAVGVGGGGGGCRKEIEQLYKTNAKSEKRI